MYIQTRRGYREGHVLTVSASLFPVPVVVVVRHRVALTRVALTSGRGGTCDHTARTFASTSGLYNIRPRYTRSPTSTLRLFYWTIYFFHGRNIWRLVKSLYWLDGRSGLFRGSFTLSKYEFFSLIFFAARFSTANCISLEPISKRSRFRFRLV